MAWALGKVSQKPGTAGCISETGTGGACQDGTALNGAFDLAASPDGMNVYVSTGVSNAVAVFDRDSVTGALTWKPGTAGCIVRSTDLKNNDIRARDVRNGTLAGIDVRDDA